MVDIHTVVMEKTVDDGSFIQSDKIEVSYYLKEGKPVLHNSIGFYDSEGKINGFIEVSKGKLNGQSMFIVEDGVIVEHYKKNKPVIPATARFKSPHILLSWDKQSYKELERGLAPFLLDAILDRLEQADLSGTTGEVADVSDSVD